MRTYRSICLACAHHLGDGACEAFPNGIPEEIIQGFDHREPFEGDNGILFELRSPSILKFYEEHWEKRGG